METGLELCCKFNTKKGLIYWCCVYSACSQPDMDWWLIHLFHYDRGTPISNSFQDCMQSHPSWQRLREVGLHDYENDGTLIPLMLMKLKTCTNISFSILSHGGIPLAMNAVAVFPLKRAALGHQKLTGHFCAHFRLHTKQHNQSTPTG